MEALLVGCLLVILVLVAVIVAQKPTLTPVKVVNNQNRRLNEPPTYYHVRVLKDGLPCDLLFTEMALQKAIYRGQRNKEDFN
jgi:hypothetical protein